MKKYFTTLLLLVAAFSFSQNITGTNLDIRNTSKLRGIIYPFGAVATSPINAAVHEVAMVNNTTFALCRMDFQEFADSIYNHISQLWWLDSPDTIKTTYYVVVDSGFRANYYQNNGTYNAFGCLDYGIGYGSFGFQAFSQQTDSISIIYQQAIIGQYLAAMETTKANKRASVQIYNDSSPNNTPHISLNCQTLFGNESAIGFSDTTIVISTNSMTITSDLVTVNDMLRLNPSDTSGTVLLLGTLVYRSADNKVWVCNKDTPNGAHWVILGSQ